MTSDDALRHALIESSRGQAMSNRNRLARSSSLPLVLGVATGLIIAWGLLSRRRGAAAAALLLGGGVWLARRTLLGDRRTSCRQKGDITDENWPELVGTSVDEASSESFPASDPPARSRGAGG